MRTKSAGTPAAIEPPYAMKFPLSSDSLYILAPDVTTSSISDEISGLLSQLTAMLGILCGESGEAFREDLTASDQDIYMRACCRVARECSELFSLMEARRAD